MTVLKGQIHREVVVHDIKRPVIVTMDAETKRLGFHEKVCRHIYWLPIYTCFAMAIAAEGQGKSRKE